MQPQAASPSDPKVWWRRLVDAVAALQAGNKEPASEYLRFVEEHRGRKQAMVSKKQLIVLRDAESWGDCRQWRGWGYSTRPPAQPKAAPKSTQRRRR